MFASVKATPAECTVARPGDELVSPADVVMDRAVTLPGSPAHVWPWLLQLGKERAGWYLPHRIERFLPPRRRATREVETQWQHLHVGDVIPDYGGRHETFRVARIHAPTSLVYTSQRGRTSVSWSITLEPLSNPGRTRVLFRLRLAPVRHRRIADTAGEFVDALTIAAMAAGLRERLAEGHEVDRGSMRRS